MKKWLFGFFALTLGLSVQAQQLESCAEAVQLLWQKPTTRTDGSALPAGEIDSYEIVLSGAVSASIAVPAPATSFTHDNPITDCGAGNLNYQIATVDTGGLVSELSDPMPLTLAGGYLGNEFTPSSVNFDSGSVEQKPAITVPSCTEINQFGCKRGN